MKVSKFTSLHIYNGETVLFNSENEKFLLLSSELERRHRDHVLNPNDLQSVHPEFFNTLQKQPFHRSCTVDEAETLIHQWEKNDDEKK